MLVDEKWLMRVKCFNLQKPVVFLMIGPDKMQAVVKYVRLTMFRFGGHILAIDFVLPFHVGKHPSRLIPLIRCRHVPFPRIAFLPTHGFPTAVTCVVGRAAVFPIMLVITDQMGIDIVLLENFGHRIVKWLDGSPTAV